jgi:hypothetical protein
MSPLATRPAGKPRSRQRGQGLVEFALVLPIFMMIVFGLIDGGRLVYMNSVLSQAAREGARLGAVEAGWIGSSDPACAQPGGPVCPADAAAMRTDILAAANREVTPFGPILGSRLYTSCDAVGSAPTGSGWNSQTCTANGSGKLLSVRAELSFTPITPVLGQLLGLTLTAASSMVIN